MDFEVFTMVPMWVLVHPRRGVREGGEGGGEKTGCDLLLALPLRKRL